MKLKIQNFKDSLSDLKIYAEEPATTEWVMNVGKANPVIEDKGE